MEVCLKHAFSYDGGTLKTINEKTLVSICGNSIKFTNISSSGLKSPAQMFYTQRNPGSISPSSLDCCWKTSKVAFVTASIESPDIQILSYPELKVRGNLRGGSKLDFSQIKFSRDGTRLLSVSDEPDNNLMVWNLQNYSALENCSVELKYKCTLASFYPANSSTFVTGGISGEGEYTSLALTFWKVNPGASGYYLNRVDATSFETPSSLTDDYDASKRSTTLTAHAWSIAEGLYVANSTGLIQHFNTSTGLVIESLTLPTEENDFATSLVTLHSQLLVGTFSGKMYWYNIDPETGAFGEEVGSTQVIDSSSSINTLCVTPSHSTVIIGTSNSSLFTRQAFYEEEDEEEESSSHVSSFGAYHQSAIVAASPLTPAGGTRADTLVATAGIGSNIWCWNNHECALTFSLDCKVECVTSLASFVNKSPLAAGTACGELYLFRIMKTIDDEGLCPKPLGRLKLFKHSSTDILVMNEDQSTLAVGSYDSNHLYFVDTHPNEAYRVITWLELPQPSEEDEESFTSAITWIDQTSVLVSSTSGKQYSFKLSDDGAAAYANQVTGCVPILLKDDAIELNKVVRRPGSNTDFLGISWTHGQRHLYKVGLENSLAITELFRDAHTLELSAVEISPVAQDDGSMFVVTGGRDGVVSFWTWDPVYGKASKQKSVAAHHGTVTAIAFIHSCDTNPSYAISVGQDGSVCFFQISYEGSQISPAEYSSLETNVGSLNNVTEEEVLSWDNQKTFLEKLEEEEEAKAKLAYDAQKEEFNKPLLQLKIQLEALVRQNSTMPEEEQLERGEFYINDDLRDQILKENEELVADARNKIQEEISRNEKMALRLKQEFWDSSEEKGTKIICIKSEEGVYNFPIQKLEGFEKKSLSQVQFLRKNELRQWRTEVKSSIYPGLTSGIKVNERWMLDDGLMHPYVTEHFQLTEPLWANSCGPLSPEAAPAPITSIVELLYHPVSMRTRKQQANQIWLVRAYGRELKQKFNKEFDATMELKATTFDEIEARNNRIREICAELKTESDTEVFQYSWNDDEKPERIFEVRDDELKSKPFESEASRKLREEKAAAQEALEAERKKGDVAGRALDDMMDGTLEVKKVSVIENTLEREPWMNEIPREEMSPEQIRELEEFEEKEKLVAEEKEKYRKSLEVEIKKLRAEINEIVKGFDEKVLKLDQLRLFTSYSILAQELYMLRLGQDLMTEEKLREDIYELDQSLTALDEKLTEASNNTQLSHEKLEACRDELHALLDEEKLQDKQFNREMEEASVSSIDPDTLKTLNELYRRNKAPATTLDTEASTTNSKDDGDDAVENYDLFQNAIELSAKVPVTNTYVPLDPDLDRPETMLPSDPVWVKLNELREHRSEVTYKIAQKDSEVEDLKVVNEALSNLEFSLQEELRKGEDHLDDISNELDTVRQNRTVMIQCKQGQNECINGSNVVNDYPVLISRNLVERLNEKILQNGKEQVAILEKMKDFRKSINLMEWEHQYLALKESDSSEHYTDLQLLRVTKHLQEFFKGGDQSQKEKVELKQTEAKLEHIKKHHQGNLRKIKKQEAKLKNQLSAKNRENERFQEQLQELRSHVEIREEILASRNANVSGSSSSQKASAKMKAITVRRKLVDVAKSQTEEIEYLRQELDRLRRKTFPSFVQTSTSTHDVRPPDEV